MARVTHRTLSADRKGTTTSAPSHTRWFGTTIGGAEASFIDVVILTALSILLAVVFVDKPFTIDDPLFLWLGRHLQNRPFDFFGFSVNWYGTEMPMHEVTQNPPLNGYYIAWSANLLGWTEQALHFSFLLPALLTVYAVYALSARLCTYPLASTVLTVATPAFLLSSTSVMCDMPMLALWCWSTVFWIRGFDRGRWYWHAAAGVTASAACLTKYFAIALVPLFLSYGIVRMRHLGWWLAWLLLPVFTLVGFEFIAHALYGHGLITQATAYATASVASARVGLLGRTIIGLMFLGGCLAHGIFLIPRLLRGSALIVVVALGVVGASLVGMLSWGGLGWKGTPPSLPMASACTALFLLGGLSLVAIVIKDAVTHHTPDTVLLSLWFCGTLVFATFVNWVNNGRSNLPLVPVIGIVIMRTLSYNNPTVRQSWCTLALWFAPGSALALAVAYGDYRWAKGVKEAAHSLTSHAPGSTHRVFFQGHWGFQYYMEQAGGAAVDLSRDAFEVGDRLIVPSNNANAYPLPGEVAVSLGDHLVPEPRWIRTTSGADGAGFYASNVGPFPYVLGPTTPDFYRVFEVRHRFAFTPEEKSSQRHATVVRRQQ